MASSDVNTRALLFSLSAGPVAWTVQMGINVSFAYAACKAGHPFSLLLVNLVALALSGAGAWFGLREWREAAQPSSSFPFLASVATLLDSIFLLLIAAQAAPLLLAGDCR